MGGRPGWDDDFEVLPDITVDETATGWGDAPDDDTRLLEERPPHWE